MTTNRFIVQDGNLIVHRTNDVEPILRHVHDKQSAGAWDTPSGDFREVGEVDWVLLEALCLKHGVTLRRFLSESDVEDRMLKAYFREYPLFKVHPGQNL